MQQMYFCTSNRTWTVFVILCHCSVVSYTNILEWWQCLADCMKYCIGIKDRCVYSVYFIVLTLVVGIYTLLVLLQYNCMVPFSTLL